MHVFGRAWHLAPSGDAWCDVRMLAAVQGNQGDYISRSDDRFGSE